MKTIVHCFFVLSFLFISCKKQVTGFENPPYEPVPTLVGILQEGKEIRIHLSLSQPIDSVHPTSIDFAEALLYKDGQLVEKLNYDSNTQHYVGNTLAESDHEYSCKVIIPGYDTLQARTMIPNRPLLHDVDFIEKAIVNDEGQICPAFVLDFDNNCDERAYYAASIDAYFRWKNNRGGIIDGYYVNSLHITSSYMTDDPILLNEGSDKLVFCNDLINDTVYSLKVNCSYGPDHNNSTNITGDVVYQVSLCRLSESCYHYIKKSNGLTELDGYTNLFLGAISPFNHYSNIVNGKGIFGAIATFTSDTLSYIY